MKRLFLASLIVLAFGNALAQQEYVDNLRRQINNAKEDTIKVLALSELALYYGFNQFDSSILYADQAIDLSKKLNYLYGSYLGLQSLFIAFNCQGNYPKALATSLENLEIAEKIKRAKPYAFVWVNYSFGLLNREMGNFSIAISQLQDAIRLNKGLKQPEADLYFGYSHLAITFRNLGQEDSALWYAQKGYELSLQSKRYIRYIGLSAAVLGEIHNELGHFDLARRSFFIGVQQSKKYNNAFFLARNYNNLAELFNKTGYPDSCIYYAGLSLQICMKQKFSDYAVHASSLLTNVYESQHNSDSTIKYIKIMLASKDSVLGQSKVKEFQKVVFDEEQRKQETAIRQDRYKARTKTWVALATLVAFLLITLIILRNISLKRKNESHRRAIAENELQLQKLESERTKAELQQEATELEMQALRAQMNPHFIFNCLSSINRFILKNESESASDYLTKFSRLIRMVLNNSKNMSIPLEDELEMLRLYLDLERLRFNHSFDYSINFYTQFDISSIFIPPLLLQPFAENAIWHGLMNKKERGILDVAFALDNNVLNCYITDNGIGRIEAEALKSKSAEKQKSMGMKITAERLALLNNTTDQAVFEIEDLVDPDGKAAGTRVTLKIRYKETIEEVS